MNDETHDLAKTLAFTIGVILQGDADRRHRIALAYQEARALVATIPPLDGDARPRIVACLERFEVYRKAEDVACAGWVLMAVQERVNEQNLRGWRKLRKAVDNTLRMLPIDKPTVH